MPSDYPTAENDLNVFSSQFGLPTCTSTNSCFKRVYAAGSKPRANCGWAEEAALDIEWAHAMAPNAKIVLVEAASNSFSNLMSAVDLASQIVANRYIPICRLEPLADIFTRPV
jgi:subtilase family serine protease